MRELLNRFLARPGIATELLLASLLANVLALASPIFVIHVLNRYVAHGVDTTLATLTAGVLIAVVLEFGFRQVRLRLAQRLGARADHALSTGVFAVLTGAKAAGVGAFSPGMQREAVTAADTVQQSLSPANVAAILDVPFALLFVGVLFLLSPVLAVITGLFLAGVFLISVASLFGLRRPSRELLRTAARRGSLAATVDAAADTVRAFNLQDFARRRWHEETVAFHALARRIARRHGLVQSLATSGQSLLAVVVISVGATLVVAGELDVGMLIGANILASRALGPVARLAHLGEVLARARQSGVLLAEVSRLPLEATRGTGIREYRGGLEFRDLAFAHPGASGPLFESVSLRLEPGAVLVVTGANGTGKTTLARLLVGLLEPSRGQILVDGVDLRQVTPEWWRRQLVYLPQEPRFLDASIRDNLLAGRPHLDDDALNTLIGAAGLKAFIDTSAGGLDGEIRGNGASLSLGIRRRLALARALATDGRLGVFDEPAEGLDAEGVQFVSNAIKTMVQHGRTLVAFSHEPRILEGAGHLLDLNTKPVPRLVALAADGGEDGAGERARPRTVEADERRRAGP